MTASTAWTSVTRRSIRDSRLKSNTDCAAGRPIPMGPGQRYAALCRGRRISRVYRVRMNITDRKATEDDNRALAHVQRLAIMGEMTAAVAHELGQPSTAIMSNAEAAIALLDSRQAPSNEMREIVTDIKRANPHHANDVLGRIQDFVRKRETPMEVVDLDTLISDVLLLIGGDVRKRRMKIREAC